MICMKKPYSLWQPTIGILDLDHCLEPCQAMFSSCLSDHHWTKKLLKVFFFWVKHWFGYILHLWMIDSKNVELWLTINLKRGTLFSKSVLFSGEANSSNLRSLLGRLHVYPSLHFSFPYLSLRSLLTHFACFSDFHIANWIFLKF